MQIFLMYKILIATYRNKYMFWQTYIWFKYLYNDGVYDIIRFKICSQ